MTEISMTKISNNEPKECVHWNLKFGIYLEFGASYLLFPR